MLTWLQFGDLHASDADGWRSLDIFSDLIDEANRHLAGKVDFAVLPGDNANHATPEQFRKIAQTAQRLQLPLYILPGDHDFETGTLDDFYEILGVKQLPHAITVDDHRCIFLDIVSGGNGGPDFRLGEPQMQWLQQQLLTMSPKNRHPVVFMHAYPNDLSEAANEIEGLFSHSQVAFVGTGHTHYNELVNHRGVIYSATRSTGEVEEGPPGFSIGALDGSVVSWHFKPLDTMWPLVLITSPADHRLVTDPSQPDQMPTEAVDVRAKIFGGSVTHVSARVDQDLRADMTPQTPGVWSVTLPCISEGLHTIDVEAATADGDVTRDSIRVQFGTDGTGVVQRDGLHQGFEPVGSWTERHLVGTQLGPNKNGRKW